MTIQTIQKRDGRVVPFDEFKVQKAVLGAIRAVTSNPLSVSVAEAVAAAAQHVAFGRHGEHVTVEQMQDAAEVALMAERQYEAAKAFILYRDQRRQARRMQAITPEVREAFRLGSEAMGDDPLRTFQFFDKYSRWNGTRRETWPECVGRSLAFLRLLVRQAGAELPESDWVFLREMMLSFSALPSMRLLAMAGPAAERDHISIYNCAFQGIDAVECFRESLLISMAGCGDGYSVESRFIRKLPLVQYQRDLPPEIFVVPDDSPGWGDALYFGMCRWFEGFDVTYDFSQVRPAGSVLKIKGGRASGPKPLRDLLLFIRKIMLAHQGMQLPSLAVNDIMTMTGTAGNSGGMRRAAKISLSDWLDQAMERAKEGEFWRHSPWRSYANNSAVWPDAGPTQLDLLGQLHHMFASGSGERGIFSRANSLRMMPERRRQYLLAKGAQHTIGTNPCGEIVLQNKGLCNLSISIAKPDDTMEDLCRKVRAAAIFGTIQSTATHFPYLRPEWAQNAREERLLGVDLVGQMDHPFVRDPVALKMLREHSRDTNREYSAKLNIIESMAITCIKPGGNSGALIRSSPFTGAKMRYGIRNARVNANSPVFRVLRACGVPMDPENGQQAETADTWVVHFPFRAPDGAVVASDLTAVQQLEQWKLNKIYWTEHNPSCTVEYSPDEMIDVIDWVWRHRDIIGGLSFLPRVCTVYRQMPYEETTREEYERAAAAFPKIDWALLAAFELEDQTSQAQEKACVSGSCET